MLLLTFALGLVLSAAEAGQQPGGGVFGGQGQGPGGVDGRRGGQGPRQGRSPRDRNGKPEPLSLFPLEAAWVVSLKTPTTVWPAFDDTSIYVSLSTGDLVALTMSPSEATTRWTAQKIEAKFPLAADGERVYAATADAVQALDAATGKVLWHRPVGGELAAPPAARAGWLILALTNGEVHALRGDSGDEVWRLALGAPARAEPLIDGDRLYFAPDDNRLVAVDLLSGKVAWDKPQGAPVQSVAAFQDGLFVGTADRMFYGLSDRDGSQRWKWRVGADAIGRALFSDDTVFVPLMDNTIRAFSLQKGAQHWRQPLDFRPRPGALRIDDTVLVIGFSPILRGYRVDNGKPSGNFTLPVGPQAEIAAPLHFVQSPFFLEDLIIAITLEGDVVAVRRKGIPLPVTPTDLPGIALPAPVWPLAGTTADESAVPPATSVGAPPSGGDAGAAVPGALVPAPTAPDGSSPATSPARASSASPASAPSPQATPTDPPASSSTQPPTKPPLLP